MPNLFTYQKPIKVEFPRGKPTPPFGPTSLEVMRSCALRTCYEISPGYERRLGFSARVGTAFHQTMESFYKYPMIKLSLEETITEARRRFQKNIKEQIEESKKHPREAGLEHQPERIDRALEAVVMEARKQYEHKDQIIHYWKSDQNHPYSEDLIKESVVGQVEVEAPVESRDGNFKGRIDRVEHQEDGTIIVDYKSALRNDVPGRYERQLQLYAYLWHDTRGVWPKQALIFYPLAVREHEVIIEPTECSKTAAEYSEMITRIHKINGYHHLAQPGDVCQVCDYRPWCPSFWEWQNAEENQSAALEKAYWGAKGKISSIEIIDYFMKLFINWRNIKIEVVSPKERFPHIEKSSIGQEVSLLEAKLHGLRYQPKAIITPRTELFLYQKV